MTERGTQVIEGNMWQYDQNSSQRVDQSNPLSRQSTEVVEGECKRVHIASVNSLDMGFTPIHEDSTQPNAADCILSRYLSEYPSLPNEQANALTQPPESFRDAMSDHPRAGSVCLPVLARSPVPRSSTSDRNYSSSRASIVTGLAPPSAHRSGNVRVWQHETEEMAASQREAQDSQESYLRSRGCPARASRHCRSERRSSGESSSPQFLRSENIEETVGSFNKVSSLFNVTPMHDQHMTDGGTLGISGLDSRRSSAGVPFTGKSWSAEDTPISSARLPAQRLLTGEGPALTQEHVHTVPQSGREVTEGALLERMERMEKRMNVTENSIRQILEKLEYYTAWMEGCITTLQARGKGESTEPAAHNTGHTTR